MSTLPDFELDVTGEYTGNAYPETDEYRVRIEQTSDGTEFRLWVEDTSGSVVGESKFGEDEADGIFKVAETDHSLDAYGDDWTIPSGIERTVEWTLPTDGDHWVRLDSGGIDAIAQWLRFALGFETYDGPEDRYES